MSGKCQPRILFLGVAVLLLGLHGQLQARTFEDYHAALLKSSPAYRGLDQQLNSIYGKLMAGLDPKTKAVLQHSQREWLKKRKSLMESLLKNGGNQDKFLINYTAERIATLGEVLYAWESRKARGGDPVPVIYSGIYLLKDQEYCQGDMELIQAGSSVFAMITTVCGKTSHICEFEGQGTITQDTAALATKGGVECKITIKFAGNQAEVRHEPMSPCCGANAVMYGRYILKK